MNTYTLLKPATLDLALHIGKSMAQAPLGSERMAMLNRIYRTMKPDAMERARAAFGATKVQS